MTPDIGEVFDPEIDFNPFPAKLLEMNGEFRSSLVIEPADGKLPYTSLAQAAMEHASASSTIPRSAPAPNAALDSLIHAPLPAHQLLIPHPDRADARRLVLTTEDMDPARIVALDAAPPARQRSHRSPASRAAAGRATRWWSRPITSPSPISAASRGAARRSSPQTAASSNASRLLAADRLLYQFTVEDPSLYKAPWLAEYVMTRTVRPVYEYACHEGNHAITNILGAARLGKQEEKKPTP